MRWTRSSSSRAAGFLLVEDNELNQIVASDLLGGVAGAHVTLAVHGQQALELLRSQAFDLVLMDVQMPVMDGHEATRRLRAVPALAALPVVAMTAHAMARDRQLCLDAGMNDFVSKPFEPSELFSVLARWLPQRRGAFRPADLPAPRTGGSAVSFESGLHHCMGRRDLYERILRRFLESHESDAVLARHALERGDSAGALAIAHSLVSTAGVIGAERLAEAARQLQSATLAADATGWRAPLEVFEHEMLRVRQALQAHLQTLGAASASLDAWAIPRRRSSPQPGLPLSYRTSPEAVTRAATQPLRS